MEELNCQDEMDEAPGIQVGHTEALRKELHGEDLAGKVKHVLWAMKDVGMDVPLFLDAFSRGNNQCTQDGKIRYHRSALLQSKELPSILL